jgi:hypothetical protein
LLVEAVVVEVKKPLLVLVVVLVDTEQALHLNLVLELLIQ